MMNLYLLCNCNNFLKKCQNNVNVTTFSFCRLFRSDGTFGFRLRIPQLFSLQKTNVETLFYTNECFGVFFAQALITLLCLYGMVWYEQHKIKVRSCTVLAFDDLTVIFQEEFYNLLVF